MRSSATAKGSWPERLSATSRSQACCAWNVSPTRVIVTTAANTEKMTFTAARRPRPRCSSPLTLGRRMYARR